MSCKMDTDEWVEVMKEKHKNVIFLEPKLNCSSGATVYNTLMEELPEYLKQGKRFKEWGNTEEKLEKIRKHIDVCQIMDKEEALALKKELLEKGYDLKYKELTTTPRDIIVHIAETMKEFMGDGIWAKIALNKVEKDERVIFTDLRFKSELKELKKRNALIVKVVCADENGDEIKGDLYQMHDFPEEEIDYIIYNKKGDWSHLVKEIRRMIEILKL